MIKATVTTPTNGTVDVLIDASWCPRNGQFEGWVKNDLVRCNYDDMVAPTTADGAVWPWKALVAAVMTG